jgi:hypothetical protein
MKQRVRHALKLTDAQAQAINDYAIGGLSYHDAWSQFERDFPKVSIEDEGEFFRLYASTKRKFKVEFAKVLKRVIDEGNGQSLEAAKFWLTHVGGWHPAQAPKLPDTIRTLQDVKDFRQVLDAYEQKLIESETPKQISVAEDDE